MTKIIGKNITAGIKKEASRGVKETTGIHYFATEKVEANPVVETVLDESSNGTLANGSDQIIVSKLGNVNVEFKAGLKSIGHILRAVAGQAPTFTGGTPNEFKFEMSNNASQDTFTLIEANAIQDLAYPLGVLEKFSMELALKTIPQFSASFKTKAPENVSVGESVADDETLLHTGFECRFGDDLGSLSSNDAICVRSFSLAIEKATNEDTCVSSSSPNDITNGIISVSGNMEVAFENMDYQNAFMNNTKKAMSIFLNGGTSGQGVQIDLPNVKLKGAPKNPEANSVVTQNIEFTALLDKTSGKQITIYLRNTEADGTY